MPFVFTVDLPFGVVNRSSQASFLTDWAPPRFTPQAAPFTQYPYKLTRAEFETSFTTMHRDIGESYSSRHTVTGIRFRYGGGQLWFGFRDSDLPPRFQPTFEDRREGLSFTVESGTGEPTTDEPFTFTELVNFLDGVVRSGQSFGVRARASFELSEPEVFLGLSSAVVNGQFRLTAVQCRTPAGALARLGALVSL